jgi:hypothetical protein
MIVRADNGGEVTTVVLPDGLSLAQRAANAIGALSLHLEPGTAPEWIESDDRALQEAIENHYKGLRV